MMKFQNKKIKKVIVIGGVTGSIGNALFEEYITDENNLIIGLSRKGVSIPQELLHHIIINIDYSDVAQIKSLTEKIYDLNPEEVIYAHCIGEFKTEISPITKDKHVLNDNDGDGINDETLEHVYIYPTNIVNALLSNRPDENISIKVITFGSLVEDHELEIFHSWTQTRKKMLTKLRELSEQYKNVCIYNILISTLLSAKEMVARPYVFGTDSNPKFWLRSAELAKRVKNEMDYDLSGYQIRRIFKKMPGFSSSRFDSEAMKLRRLYELYGI